MFVSSMDREVAAELGARLERAAPTITDGLGSRLCRIAVPRVVALAGVLLMAIRLRWKLY